MTHVKTNQIKGVAMPITEDDVAFQEDRKEIESFLELQPTAVKDDCKIVSATDANQDFMLRIDKHPPEVFVPNMPKSAMSTENTNTPRITVAPTIVGCMIGYFRIERDVQDGTMPDANGYAKFAGGYTISRLPFKHCLKPGTKMVIDSISSDEHWIVPYSLDSIEVEPERIGQIFVGSITFLPVSGHHPGVRTEMYLSVEVDMELPIMPNVRVGQGYYRYVVYWKNIRTRSVTDEQSLISIEKIEQADYLSAKKAKAALLSMDNKPSFVAW